MLYCVNVCFGWLKNIENASRSPPALKDWCMDFLHRSLRSLAPSVASVDACSFSVWFCVHALVCLVCMLVCMHACMCVCMCALLFVHACVCVCVCVCVCLHVRCTRMFLGFEACGAEFEECFEDLRLVELILWNVFRI